MHLGYDPGDKEKDGIYTGLTQFDDFWGALRPKNHQTALVFRSKCVSPTIA
jgi:hypothetical protein